MVLDQFQTTYRKDYIWPYVRAYGLKTTPALPEAGDHLTCECHCPKIDKTKQVGLDQSEAAWSRLGPMGPLLDPKVYPVKVGASPESQVSRFNQPNVYLQKLKDKFPYIYECLRNAPPDDLISRINRDRLRTTYQVDYCKLQEYPDAPYDELLRAAGVSGIAPCPAPVRLPGDPCRPNQRSIAYRPAVISNRVGGGKSEGRSRGGDDNAMSSYCAGSCRGPLGSMTAGATEYQDAISRLGQMIMRDKIHFSLPKKII
ncbi:uncharacterized protein LOC103312874 [Tribolium castaneum]|nr:PREDICTED: uncharacterized protein LOC656012 [Tribolium castaneum]|eukprot:XP_967661.1 PREDICTED: uncharacterized protein LOC656012 [Tribolium castaneum]